jgi:hypothetical protein
MADQMHQKMWMQKARKKKAYLHKESIAHQPHGGKGSMLWKN